MTNTPTWISWKSMRARCFNHNHPEFKNYGARGISVCEQWDTFEGFFRDMGERPLGKTLGRINNDWGYFKSNCRWEDWFEQGRNRRNVYPITFGGQTLCLAEWARIVGVGLTTLHWRLKKGWPMQKVLDPDTSYGKHERTKTHCPKGHPYSQENTFIERDGSRKCIICRKTRERNRKKL